MVVVARVMGSLFVTHGVMGCGDRINALINGNPYHGALLGEGWFVITHTLYICTRHGPWLPEPTCGSTGVGLPINR